MPAEVVTSIAALRARLAAVRLQSTARTSSTPGTSGTSGTLIGLVPTMGALHIGHARLIQQARDECQAVAVSVFVNPTQFDRQDDLDRYPRTFDADRALCDRLGVDLIFAPSVDEMYPSTPQCSVTVGSLADHLCGRYRPGHFQGVATVVLKLLDIAQPDRAYFGEKDAQQLAIVRRLVADFNVPVHVVGVPTVREADGLAVSSRNTRLTADERAAAPALYRALTQADRQISAGVLDTASLKNTVVGAMPVNPELRLEYLEIVDPVSLQPVDRVQGRVLVAGAMWVGSTRLIDNVTSEPPQVHVM